MKKIVHAKWFFIKRFAKGLVLLLIFSIDTNVLAETDGLLNTSAVVQKTLSAVPQCLRYKVVGTCFWLTCTGPYCHVTTTLKVEHYLPDAVTSVFRSPQSNPWDFANKTIDKAAYEIGKQQIKTGMHHELGYGNANASLPYEQNTHFKEADLIGNPAISFFKKYGRWLLPSTATPFTPYYVSLLDAYIWRSPFIEMARYPYNLVPGVHIVGSLVNNWGSVYPRTGFLIQPQDGKAAAVMAQRAASIATQPMQPHIYQPLPSGADACGTACETSEAKENSEDTLWQMIYPLTETQCKPFGENDLAQKTPWGSEAYQQGNGNYAWVLWRKYRGCIQGEGKYLGSIDFNR